MPHVLTPSDVKQFRDRVCVVATELFAELGYDGFNMRRLAARLGVSAMTAYRYFDGKTDILAAVRARGFVRLAERLETAGDDSETMLGKIATVCQAYVDFAREEQTHYRLMFDLSQPQLGRSAELAGAERRAFEALATHVRVGAPGSDADRLARILWASLHGITALSLMETSPTAESDDLIPEIVRRFAAPGGVPDEFEPGQPLSARDRQPHRSDWRESAATNTIPLTAAE